MRNIHVLNKHSASFPIPVSGTTSHFIILAIFFFYLFTLITTTYCVYLFIVLIEIQFWTKPTVCDIYLIWFWFLIIYLCSMSETIEDRLQTLFINMRFQVLIHTNVIFTLYQVNHWTVSQSSVWNHFNFVHIVFLFFRFI